MLFGISRRESALVDFVEDRITLVTVYGQQPQMAQRFGSKRLLPDLLDHLQRLFTRSFFQNQKTPQ